MEFKIDQDRSINFTTIKDEMEFRVENDLYKESVIVDIPKDLVVKIAIEMLKQAYSITEEDGAELSSDIYELLAGYVD